MVALLMLVCGLFFLCRGKYHLSPMRTVDGNRALTASLLLILPLPSLFFTDRLLSLLASPHLMQLSAAQATALNDSVALGITFSCLIGSLFTLTTAPARQPAVATQAALGYRFDVGVWEAASYLQLSVNDVIRLIEQGQLRARKDNKTYRIDIRALHSLKGVQ